MPITWGVLLVFGLSNGRRVEMRVHRFWVCSVWGFFPHGLREASKIIPQYLEGISESAWVYSYVHLIPMLWIWLLTWGAGWVDFFAGLCHFFSKEGQDRYANRKYGYIEVDDPRAECWGQKYRG